MVTALLLALAVLLAGSLTAAPIFDSVAEAGKKSSFKKSKSKSDDDDEEVASEESSEEEEYEDEEADDDDDDDESGGLGWLWIILVLALIAFAVWYFLIRRRE